jgi:hypothetical protein
MLNESYFQTRRQDLVNALAKIEGDIKQHAEAFHRIQGAIVELDQIVQRVNAAAEPVAEPQKEVENES